MMNQSGESNGKPAIKIGGNMYCPSCGVENAYGLRYCKRCGENLNNQSNAVGGSFKKVKRGEYGWEIEEVETPGINMKKLTGMFWAVAVFGIVSLLSLFGSMIPLTVLGAGRHVTVPLLIFGASAIVVISGMLIRQLSRLISMAEYSQPAPRRVTMPTEQNYPQVAAPPRSVSSVTEHTTRNFDHSAYNEQRTGE
jgi:hypothetical protein